MARGQSRRKVPAIPEAKEALDRLKYEIAAELGIPVGPQLSAMPVDAEFATELGSIPAATLREDYWGHVASRETGAVGGHLVRRLVRQAELALERQ